VRVGALINTALYDYCPEVIEACVKRGDELIGHGHTNSERQGEMTEMLEKALLKYCRERIEKQSGQKVQGWLSPWISESFVTPDLLQETGYSYSLNWCHDDQPVEMKTRGGKIWAVPYPQELNDIPAIIHRQMSASAFADLIVDNFDEMLEQSRTQPLVMGIALHPYIVGQPHRLRQLRRALQHIVKEKRVWFTTPGAIASWVGETPSSDANFLG
jgi:peptidoglycan/xylan/chitin deacetylase (PgdA/CDA1 family)